MITTIAIIVAALLTVPLLVLAIECWLSLLPLRRHALSDEQVNSFSLAVVVPAHDEVDRIADAVQRIKQQIPADAPVIVVADNCTDATAANARAAGAVVLERNEPERRGKGYALNFAWGYLKRSPPDVVVFIDADCVSDPGCIATIARLAHERHRPAQARYAMYAPAGAGGLANVSALAVYVKNVVRPRGLQRFGLPCLLAGSAMAFPREALAAVRHSDGYLAEDLRASVDFAIAGFAPIPCMEVGVSSPLPSARSGFMSQRTRWEHGHLRTILTDVPRLLAKFLRTGSGTLLALALELAVPPLSLLVGITAVGALVLAGIAWSTSNWIPLFCVLCAMAAAGLGLVVIWAREGREILPGKTLAAQIPRYIGVKAPLYLRFLVKPQTDWVRTERAQPLSASSDGIPKPHVGNFGSIQTATPPAAEK